MPWKSNPDLWGLLGAVLISLISGLISLASRLAKGHPLNFFWVVSEGFMGAAMLIGYLVYDLYPIYQEELPRWATMPICVAFSAHLGGRLFQWIEFKVKDKFQIPDSI
ncbi:hypothetical protein [Pseudomonas phage PJNP053]